MALRLFRKSKPAPEAEVAPEKEIAPEEEAAPETEAVHEAEAVIEEEAVPEEEAVIEEEAVPEAEAVIEEAAPASEKAPEEYASVEAEASESASTPDVGPTTEEILELDQALQKLNDRKAEAQAELDALNERIAELSGTRPYEKAEEWIASGNEELAKLAQKELASLNHFKQILDEINNMIRAIELEAKSARIKNGENVL
ncbi:MAG: hypothetical protein K6F32_01370 [Bacilli bacterium]|nr:hypothetical protein [Bacilli bacterium]